MTTRPAPQLPDYRITLFYGPEPLEGLPAGQCCVFNVKKRSWKGGVQVAVEVPDRQLASARQVIGLEALLTQALAALPPEDHATFRARAHEVLTQVTCALKLNLAVARGLPQENGRLGLTTMADDLDIAINTQKERLRTQIFAELDVGGEADASSESDDRG